MGEVRVPSDALYGASTARAIENFPISKIRFPGDFISVLCRIKACSAKTNEELGLLDHQIAKAIVNAANSIADGAYRDQFPVDIFQTGSGTSTNMNANEVIANLALVLMGKEKGARDVIHPNDHVNLGMSSNDVIPTAIHITAYQGIKDRLLPALNNLEAALEKKATQFMPVIKTGRTHLQDAVPISLGQEFLGYAGQVKACREKLAASSQSLRKVALGGTAVGTGLNTRKDFASLVLKKLSRELGDDFEETDNHFRSQSSIDDIVNTSSSLKVLAVALLKISNDLRFLSSGPRAGYGELRLPEVQPGSSIMPGKVNPVILESLCMVCAQVIGNDSTLTIAGQSGNFELNVMLPVAAHNLFESIEILSNAVKNVTEKCILEIDATDVGPKLAGDSLSLATALVPKLGYDIACQIAKDAHATGRTVLESALALTELEESELKRLLDPASMTGL